MKYKIQRLKTNHALFSYFPFQESFRGVEAVGAALLLLSLFLVATQSGGGDPPPPPSSCSDGGGAGAGRGGQAMPADVDDHEAQGKAL